MHKQKMTVLFLSALICGVLLFFYIQPLFASTENLVIEVETLSGEQEAAASITLQGTHYLNNGERMLEVTTGGTEYSSDELALSSYLERNDRIKELQKKFPAFMRGKDAYVHNFAEDGQYLYYSEGYYNPEKRDPVPVALMLEQLDKQTGNIEKRQLEVAGSKTASAIHIWDFQSRGNTISIHLEIADEQQISKEVVYLYDWIEGEIMGQVDVGQLVRRGSDGSSTMLMLSNSPQPQLLLNNTAYTYHDEGSGNYSENRENSFWLLDPEVSQPEEIILPPEWLEADWNFVFDSGALYFMNYESGRVGLRIYDTIQKQVTTDLEREIHPELFTISEYSAQPRLVNLDDDHLLLFQSELSRDVDTAGMLIIEKAGGEILYEGVLKANHQQNSEWSPNEFVSFSHIKKK